MLPGKVQIDVTRGVQMNVTRSWGSILPFLFPHFPMEKSDAIRLRIQVQSLAKQGLSVSEIARRLAVSRLFVRTWKDAKDPTVDQRGWVKGQKRKYTRAQEQKVLKTRDKAEEGFFLERMRSTRPSVMRSLSTSSSARSSRTVAASLIARKRKDDRNICSTRSASSKRLERR